MYDWNLLRMPEGIDPEEYVIAVYIIETKTSIDMINHSLSIALEQLSKYDLVPFFDEDRITTNPLGEDPLILVA